MTARQPKANAEYMRDYYHNKGGKAKQRAYQHNRKYGITIEQRDAILLSQGGVCAGCLRGDPGADRDWHTDHCHETGVVRGVLCHGCNTSLGGFKHDTDTLMRMIKYLERGRLNV